MTPTIFFIKNPQTTNVPTFLTHNISAIGGVLDVKHFIMMPLWDCFTNKLIIISRKSLVVLDEVAALF